MKAAIVVLFVVQLGCGSLWAGCDALEFARALDAKGYSLLSIKYFEEALAENAIAEKDKDDLYLDLYKSYSQISSMQTGALAAESAQKAESYFSKIKDGTRPEVQLEKVNADSKALTQIDNTWRSADPKELDAIKKRTKELFLRVAGVTDTIRKAARKWLDEYDNLDEKEQRSLARQVPKQSGLEINASLKFGEACVIYASVVGHKDPEVRKWLENMAKSYNDFIANNYGSFASIVGSVYLGQVKILLESYQDVYGAKKDGVEDGAAHFRDAVAGLEEFSGQKNLEAYVKNWMLQSYLKQSQALSIIGREKNSIEVLKKLFDWKPLQEATPKLDEGFHDQMMSALQTLCQKLKKAYDSGDKKAVNDLMDYTLKGFNFTKKVDSRWSQNFKVLLGGLPTDDPAIVETLDIAYMKADKLYSHAVRAPEAEQKKAFYDVAMKYKKVVEMCISEGKTRMDEMFPLAAERLGASYMKIDNNLLALGIFLKAVDLYPSSKYNEAQFPEIYRSIRRCAISAKSAAIRRYLLAGKRPFDQGLYEQTLTLISEQFPEEGGDPEYFLGVLRKAAGDYQGAYDLLSKLGPDSKMYYKAQLFMVDCELQKVTDGEANGSLKDDALRQGKKDVIGKYEQVAKLAMAELKKPAGMTPENFKYMMDSKVDSLGKAYEKMGYLYYQLEDFSKSYKCQAEMLSKAVNEDQRFASLKFMILSGYNLGDMDVLSKDIALYEKLKPNDDLSQATLDDFRAKAYQYKANLVIKQKLNPLSTKMEGLKGEALKALKVELNQAYVETADLLYQSLLISEERNEDLLKSVIAYYYTSPEAREKALVAMNLYFKWYPNKPMLDDWYKKGLGQSTEAWDDKLGGLLKNKAINLPVVEKTYLEFLDLLFDRSDYSQMRLAEVRKKKKDNNDEPRNYQLALGVFDKLEGMTKRDLNFAKLGWPVIAKLKSSLVEANGYYGMRYQQAQCLSLLKKYSEASEVYKELSHYYVEYPEIRIELAKAEFAQNTLESYQRAEVLFADLLNVVPGPNASGYDPKEFFSLQWWNTRTKLAIAGGQKAPAEKVVEAWKFLRSMVYQDLGYMAKESQRFNQLKITGPAIVVQEGLIDDFKAWVEENIFPVVKISGGPLAGDSWKSILGEEK
jgi:hypothetical protein